MVPNENVRLSGELVNSHPPFSDNLRDLRLRKTILKSDDDSVLSQEIFQKTDSINVSLLLPHVNCFWTIALSVIIGLVISSAFSSIVVYATDLMPDRIGMISGVFFGLMFGLGGIGSAFFGWLADKTSIWFIFNASAYLPLLGIVAGFLPDTKKKQ